MLSPYFALQEFTRTSTGLTNIPGPEEVANLQALVDNVLHPARVALGPIHINSGFLDRYRLYVSYYANARPFHGRFLSYFIY